jgi:phage major head subunit gpT-like protein
MPNRNSDDVIDPRDIADSRRAASLVPNSWRDEDSSVDVVFATESLDRDVIKYDWRQDKPYIERLPFDGLDLADLNAGAHVLRAHQSYSLGDILGSTVPGTAAIGGEPGSREASVRVMLSDQASDSEDVAKIRSGVIRKWSYGYEKLGKPAVTTDPATGYEVRTWAAHRPFEVSPVPVPADGRTHTRAHSPASAEQTTVEIEMSKTPEAPSAPVTPAAPGPDVDTIRAQAMEDGRKAEATRQHEIRSIATRAKLGDEWAAPLLSDPSVTVDAVRAKALDALATEDEKTQTAPHVEIGVEARDKARRGMAAGLAHAARPQGECPAEGREFAGMRMRDIAIEAMGMDYRKASRMAEADIFDQALRGDRAGHTTSDFPYILQDAVNKNFLAGMAAEPLTYQPLATMRPVRDFKTVHEISAGSFGALQTLPEATGITYDTFTEGEETGALVSYALGFEISRKALINDDLSALGRIPAMMGASINRTKNDLAWLLVTANAALADGVAFFHANHANYLAAAAAIDKDELGKGRLALRIQTDLDGARLGLLPSYLVGPAALETAFDELLTQVMPTQSSEVTPSYIRSLQPVIEPRLDTASATAYYLVVNPASRPCLMEGYLVGAESPAIESEYDFDTKGQKYSILYDRGFWWADYRGWWKAVGA